jgi:hypothetical protein
VRAYVLTCEERQDVCAQTVAELLRTDWGSAPTLVVDGSAAPGKLERILDNGRRLLTHAIDDATAPDDVFLFLEDDVTCNRSLRHNIERWSPVVDRRPDGHLFASLYNPNAVPFTPGCGSSATVGAAPHFYGTQGMVLSVVTARSLVEQWDDADGPLDLRIARLATRWSPLWYHRPSLVQHRSVESTWGGRVHVATDFDEHWRA